MVCLVYFAGCWSNSSEDSMYSLMSSASLPSRPVNCAVQHFTGFSQEPGSLSPPLSVSQAIDFTVITSLMCNLLFYANKEVTGLCQIKGVLVLFIFWTTLTDQSEWTFLYASITNILHIRIKTPENIPSLVENPVSHGRKVKLQVWVPSYGCATFFIGSRLHPKQ